MIKSKFLRKIAGLPAEDVEYTKEGFKKCFYKKAGIKKPKPYPVQEEDILTAPDDDSAEVKYITKKNKAKH